MAEFRYLDIESIHRSAWWPVKHRPMPTPEEIDRAKNSGLVTPVVVRRKREAGGFEPTFEIIDNEVAWATAQAAEIHQVPSLIMEIGRLEARDLVLSRYHAQYPPDAPDDPLPSSSDTTDGPIALALRYKAALGRIEEQERAPRRRPGRRKTIGLVAKEFGTTSTQVRQYLNLLELAPEVQRLVSQGAIPYGSARLMNKLPSEDQISLATTIIRRRMSVRDVERWLKEHREGLAHQDVAKKGDPDLVRFARTLSETTGGEVEIRPKGRGGKLIVSYGDPEHLEAILERPILPREG